MIQNTGIIAQRMSPNILKIRFLNTFFYAKSKKKPFKNLWKKLISRHFQLVRISYQKLDFHGISRFSAVFIINNLNAWRFHSGKMDTKS
jgi:hypothetical protein